MSELIIETAAFGLAFWLGLYLIGRNPADRRLLLAGSGLAAYALGLALDLLAAFAPDPVLADALWRWQRPFLLLPALFWIALLFLLLRDERPWRERLRRQPRPVGVLIAATIFFGLGFSLWLFPLGWIPRFWLLLGIGLDLVLLGWSVAVFDAFDEGEALLPHFLRSFHYALLTALLFAGQIVLVMVFSTGVTLPLLVLLLTTIIAALLIQTLSTPLADLADRIAFAAFPQVRRARAELRAAANAVERIERRHPPDISDQEEFARLTRRALSQMGNLPRLASSPLTRLPLVEARLAQRGLAPDTLARAKELKALLTESIERLKPRGDEEFGATDAWRYYNALYFPYVAGLKPYSRRATHEELETAAAQALAWFRREVPQRTLYNWQNAAARLVARDLHDRSQRLGNK